MKSDYTTFILISLMLIANSFYWATVKGDWGNPYRIVLVTLLVVIAILSARALGKVKINDQ